MSQRLGAALGHLGGTAAWLAPLLALLGALLTNSNLGSASLVAQVQQQVAAALAAPGLLLGGLQSVGAILGRMLAPSYLLLASSDVQRVTVLWRRMALLVLPLLLALEETLAVVLALQTGRGNGTIWLWGVLLIGVTAVVTNTCAHWAARWSKQRAAAGSQDPLTYRGASRSPLIFVARKGVNPCPRSLVG